MSMEAVESDMVTMRTLKSEMRDAVLDIARRHGARNVRVFGSVARGDSTPESDADLLVDWELGPILFT